MQCICTSVYVMYLSYPVCNVFELAGVFQFEFNSKSIRIHFGLSQKGFPSFSIRIQLKINLNLLWAASQWFSVCICAGLYVMYLN